jgi:hypothetical protein
MTRTRRSLSLPWRLMRFLNRHLMPKTRPEVRLRGLSRCPELS